MKTTNNIEVIGIGNFKVISIKEKENDDLPLIDENFNELEKRQIEKGTQAKYIFINPKTKQEVTKDKVYYNFNSIKVQQIKRSEKIKKFDIVDKTEIYNLSELSISLLDSDDTTRINFDKIVSNNAIRFIYKKSTIGFTFWKAYILKLFDELFLITGKGDIKTAIKEYKENKKTSKEVTEVSIQKLVVNADDLEIEL